jgi:ATP-dependent protease ClpP protease subunit
MPKLTDHETQLLKNVDDSNSWYRIDVVKAAKGKPAKAEVYVYDEISPWGVSAQRFADELKGLDVNEIDLHVNSPGGSFHDGIAIMNNLRNHKARVTTYVDGLAASAASLIALAGDEVVMAKGSEMMIHEASAIALGKAAEMQRTAERLNKHNASMAQIYADKAGGTPEEWWDAMRAESWYTDTEAVTAGLADRLDATAKEEEVVAARTKFDFSVFAHAGRAKAPAPFTPTAEPPVKKETEEGQDMPTKQLVAVATALGVKDADKLADDDAVAKAIEDHRAAEAKALKDAEDKAAAEDKTGDKPVVTNANLPKGFMVVDEATIADLQTSAKRADAVVKQIDERDRESALDEAVAKGKIPVSRREHWASYWDSDKEGAKVALAALPAGLVPLEPIGTGADSDSDLDADYRALYANEVN